MSLESEADIILATPPLHLKLILGITYFEFSNHVTIFSTKNIEVRPIKPCRSTLQLSNKALRSYT